MARGIDPQVHRRLAPAFAYGFELDQRVGQREQGGGPGEKLGLEIGAQAVAEHRQVHLVSEPAQLQHLSLGQELGLVDQHAVQPPPAEFGPDRLQQVGRRIEGVGVGADLQPLASEPIRLAPEAGKSADLAWGLHCTPETCSALAALPAASLRVTKALLKDTGGVAVQARMAEEAGHFATMLRAPEAREAMTAFFEKRKPDFRQFD